MPVTSIAVTKPLSTLASIATNVMERGEKTVQPGGYVGTIIKIFKD